jgi:hypothetical protein
MDAMLFKQVLLIAAVLLCSGVPAFAQSYDDPAEPGTEAKSSINRKELDAHIDESIKWLNKAKELLRLASVRLPDLIKDTSRFRTVDRAIELCREETYPAVAAAERVKKNPRALRSLVQLYLGMRLLQLRCVVLSERLSCPPTPETANMSTQMMDLSNYFGKVTLKLHPYVYKVVDSYETSAPSAKIDAMIPLDSGSNF